MKKLLAAAALAVAFVLATTSPAFAAETKLSGTVTQIRLAADKKSAEATVKDDKTGDPVLIQVEDAETLKKFQDGRIGPGEEVKVKYEKKGKKNLATYFKKAAGC